MEGDLIKINEWLLPLSWLYGLGVKLRNLLFDMGVLKSESYDIPVISIGNITVGGTGKTPHTEYLLRLLLKEHKVAVLSRGYKRKSKGYLLAGNNTPMEKIGDEPYQMKQKFPEAYIAVDKNRRRGIERICNDDATADTDVILLDDAYQHRYVKPDINILLVDYHRMISEDCLLPAGRLREPRDSQNRASIVVVTKCPTDLKPMEFRVIQKALNLYPYQKLFFSTFRYGCMKQLFGTNERTLNSLTTNEAVLLLTGIASPEQMRIDLEHYTRRILPLPFGDHHYFSTKDAEQINNTFRRMEGERKLIITTEKDACRLRHIQGLDETVRENLYVLPVEVEIMRNQGETFNEKILGYVLKNSGNSRLAKNKNVVIPDNRHYTRNRTGQTGL